MSAGNLNVVHASALVLIADRGPRCGADQGRMEVVADGAVAIRDGVIVAVGTTDAVLADFGDAGVATIDARGKTVLPGLVEAHSHPLFGGHRHHEYAERLGGATLAEVAARGGGIWSSVTATRATPDLTLIDNAVGALDRMLAGGVTTAEVKSGYGLTVAHELHQLELLARVRDRARQQLIITFLGAHVVPRDPKLGQEADPSQVYANLVAGPMTDAVVAQGIAQYQDVTVEVGLFTPDQALAIMTRSRAARASGSRARRCVEAVGWLADGCPRWRRFGRPPDIHHRRRDRRGRRNRDRRRCPAGGGAHLHD